MSVQKAVAILLTTVMVSLLSACGSNTQIQQTTGADISTLQDQDVTEEDIPVSNRIMRGTIISIGQDGNLDITRCEIGDIPMGEPETWTVFVYLCGSDLESGNDRSSGGYATYDLSEMLNASTGDEVRFVIQTGGSSAWQNNEVSPNEIGRYEICNGNITKIETQNNASMGDAATLSDFLSWGVTTYPAANMGLVLWDHGGGCIAGVCLDRVWNNDILYLKEIDSALASVSPMLTEKFEFIGFDACLMATVECANMLSPYAKYMYASEEVEPGGGWNYETIGNYLGENPLADGDALGRVVCDSYYEDSSDMSITTFSIVDLSKIDSLVNAFHSFSKQIDAASVDTNTYAALVRNIQFSDNFGGNTKATGYSNMVDLAGIVSAGTEYADNAETVISTIEDVVIYSKNNIGHENACGLSTYYPLAFNSSAELSIFSDLAISPYYLSFVTRTAYGLTHNGDMSGYVAEEIVDEWNASWNNETVQEEEDNDAYWNNFDSAAAQETDYFVEFSEEPGIRDYLYETLSDGESIYRTHFNFALTEASNAQIVRCDENVFKVSDDGKSLIYLGDYFLGLRREDGRYSFGNLISMYNIGNVKLAPYYLGQADKVNDLESDYDLMLLVAPIYLNGKESNLIFGPALTRRASYKQVYGVWDGVGDGFDVARITSLKEGDVIESRFLCLSAETIDIFYVSGDRESVIRGNVNPPVFFKGSIEEGDYYVNYTLYDAYGNYYNTVYVKVHIFSKEPGAIYNKITFVEVVENPLVDLMADYNLEP